MDILKPEAHVAPRSCRSLELRREAGGATFKIVRTVVMSSVFTTWPHRRILRGRDVLEFCFDVVRALPNWPRLLRFNQVPLSAGRLERRTTGGERRRVCTDAICASRAFGARRGRRERALGFGPSCGPAGPNYL